MLPMPWILPGYIFSSSSVSLAWLSWNVGCHADEFIEANYCILKLYNWPKFTLSKRSEEREEERERQKRLLHYCQVEMLSVFNTRLFCAMRSFTQSNEPLRTLHRWILIAFFRGGNAMKMLQVVENKVKHSIYFRSFVRSLVLWIRRNVRWILEHRRQKGALPRSVHRKFRKSQ